MNDVKAAVGGPALTSSGVRAWQLCRRAINWHEDAGVVAWWQQRLGWALRRMTPSRRRAMLATVVLLITTVYLPSIAVPGPGPTLSHDLIASCLVAVVIGAILWLVYAAAKNFAAMPGIVRRHPNATLHLLFWCLLVLPLHSAAISGRWRTVMAGVAMMLTVLLWRLGYMLFSAQRGKMAGTGFPDHLIYLLPIVPGPFADLPFGKGADYLSRFEARDEEALARSQLAGIKLVALAFAWTVLLSGMNGLVYGVPNRINQVFNGTSLALPTLGQLLIQGGGAPWWQAWLGIYLQLVNETLRVAIWGHLAVGTLRVLGFNVFRNTYKPLLSETVLQFWGRWMFYWKEVLVDFFFLPTFAKWFRQWPAARMFAAVFAAAFVGNMYSYLLIPSEVASGNLVETLWTLRSRFFYCLLLTLGIFVSMRREQRRAGQGLPGGMARRFVRMFWVWSFFAIVRIWDHYPEVPFTTRTEFFLSMFGLA